MSPENLIRRVLQVPGVRSLWRKFPLGSVRTRVRFGSWSRPNYAYGIYAAADQAKRLQIPAISVFELGVAGGSGLVALEQIACEISRYLNVQISVFGFDGGAGMPSPEDYRDLPHVWGTGFYEMDQLRLRRRLRSATLIVGRVQDTIPAFVQAGNFPPIGFVAFDLDYYSSTKAAFALFSSQASSRIPRIYCYFDDVMWPEYACHNEYVGELCAIREFNHQHESMKIAPVHLLRNMMPNRDPWNDQMYVMHDFRHPLYCVNLTEKTVADTQKPL